MRPRTLAIVLTVILGGAITVRLLSQWLDWWPTSEEAWLKRATAISVRFIDGGQLKTRWISDANELKDILGRLSAKPRVDRFSVYYPPQQSSAVVFYFRGGATSEYQIISRNEIGHLKVDRAFTDKLQEVVSRHEGRAIDLFAAGDPFVGKR